MNKIDKDILLSLNSNGFISQRTLSENVGYSLGGVSQSLGRLSEEGFLDERYRLTDKAKSLLTENKPERAIILAAGICSRAIPIARETPKAFLEVGGEKLIERQLKQLHEAGITEIYIVVGYMKERFEYLMDAYGVHLIVNADYAVKNNLHSLYLARGKLENAYIVPSDIYFEQNPFRKDELYSWYMVSDYVDEESTVRINRKGQLVKATGLSGGNAMIGLSFLAKSDSSVALDKLNEFEHDGRHDDSFWEEILFDGDDASINYRIAKPEEAIEINTYEQLRDLDPKSKQLENDAIKLIEKVFGAKNEEISEIKNLKKGMTNRSFLFSCRGKRYIMRIPGEGTDKLINRKEEAEVYSLIHGTGISDDVIYINPENGYKISEYIEGVRNCDAYAPTDVKRCMAYLRKFHSLRLKANHTFDIFKQIDFYEGLWTEPTAYNDYKETKKHVIKLKEYIDANKGEYFLTHIDAVPDNFLMKGDDIKLIDWEYAGMQDQDVDIAMFAIYALYEKKEIDELIDAYYVEGCEKERRAKIYCYIAACGLLWSNWCEYKRMLGVEFGDYSLRQYRYAKDFYKYAKELIK